MSNHKIALVPLATGYFQSPELLMKGRKADTGLFAESLIYYDSVYVHVDNPEQLASFISLLIQQGLHYEKLIELVGDGTIRFFNTVHIMPFMGTGHPQIITSLYQMQEQSMDEPNYFSKKFLEFDGLRNSFSGLSKFDSKTYNKFCEFAENTAITFSGETLGGDAIDNAYNDCFNPKRFKIIARNFYKELYKLNNMGKLPNIEVTVKELDSNNIVEISRNLGSTILGRDLGNNSFSIHELDIRPKIKPIPSLENKNIKSTFSHSPVVLAGYSNLFINSAARLNCDFFLANPVSKIVGNKLFEISDFELTQRINKIQNIIELLENKVEFPDLRRFVNSDKIDFSKVLEVRNKAKRFREWLQTETDRDRDAFFAYHNEVAKQTGFTKVGKKSLKIFGVLASFGLSVFTEVFLKDQDVVTKESVKKLGGKFVESLFDYGSKRIGEEWKPICFGNWYKDEIENLLIESSQN